MKKGGRGEERWERREKERREREKERKGHL